ncbi:hypothetical protein [Verrucomicrobium spinosum]|uniref:hypothetical protein n=1 Tax=Verrucomicrobium spinosum TaxID=2736 RepID=UPI0012F66B04|nr:hypothetical protein [Verrucomicrobium spinosum]
MTTSLTTQPAVTPPASASSTDPAGRPATCHSAILESLREGGRGRVFRDHLRRSLAQQQGSGTSPLTPDDIQIETIGVTLVDAILYDLATRHELGQLLASCDDLTLGEMTETLELMALVALRQAQSSPTQPAAISDFGRRLHDDGFHHPHAPDCEAAARQRHAALAARRETLGCPLTFPARVAALRKDPASPVPATPWPDQVPQVPAAK